MRDRSAPPAHARRKNASATVSIDLVLCAPHGRHMDVCLAPSGTATRRQWGLPTEPLVPHETLADAAMRVATSTIGTAPAWLEQVGAFRGDEHHAGGAGLTVGFVGLTPAVLGSIPANGPRWFPRDHLPPLAPGQRAIVDAAMATLHQRIDTAPIAFRLLPARFTLGALQEVYELLLGRRLHKASFRRALHAARLVKPTDEWHSEGRGRPAQLFRYVPRKPRRHRSVRFELVGG